MKRSIKFLGWALLYALTYETMVHFVGFERTVIVLLACYAAERTPR